jgi:hypothetical protein
MRRRGGSRPLFLLSQLVSSWLCLLKDLGVTIDDDVNRPLRIFAVEPISAFLQTLGDITIVQRLLAALQDINR